MSRYCLDTSAYIDALRGDRRCGMILDAAAWVGVPAIVLGELRAGFRLGAGGAEEEARLSDFLASPTVEVVPVDDDVAACYADIVVDLRRAGTPIPVNDVWIAACAAHTGSTVLTADAHFERVGRIGVLAVGRQPGGS
ncbi:PIN domain-containing protein [Candidatus Palauibacter sp.]|uniref:PIN domain-containing protein n=1 Tax=Candidatus Palauibacter sp. TaxID=3101350 RepID=UPI003AF30191